MTGRLGVRLVLPRRLTDLPLWLCLALVVFSRPASPAAAGAPPPQAGDPVSTSFTLQAKQLSGPVCVGRTYTIPVYAVMTNTYADGQSFKDSLFGITVEATLSNPEPGAITPEKSYTGAGQTVVLDLANPKPPAPSSASFTFQAKQAGDTVIWFEGVVRSAPHIGGDRYVSVNVPIKVVNCNFQITISSLGNMDTQGAPLVYIVGSVAKGELKLEPGVNDVLAGTTPSAWFSITSAPVCEVSVGYASVDASFRGTLNQDGSILHLTVSYPHVTMNSAVVCPLMSGYNAGENAPHDVEVRVPTTGGTFTVADPGDGFPLWGFPMHGTAQVTVTPIEAK